MATILPSTPTVNTPITIRTQGSGCGARASAEVDGFTISFRETQACLCWSAPPPYSIDVNIGQLPAGEYTLVSSFGYFDPDDSTCPLTTVSTSQAQFNVLGFEPNHAVPVMSPGAYVALALLILSATLLNRLCPE